ncbi:cupredoxin domain-containing protein [Candidatus Daviesbacteria bacterium]|nr:cupredoxin domain-containing protein [Candidatus Daviesbacteria bacterium]
MTADKILVLLFSGLGIVFTYWFFLMRKEEEVRVVGNSIDITVEGGYKPDVISIPEGKTTKINFLRKDPSSCLEEVVIGDFKIRKFLPLNEKVSIEITPKKKGEFSFSCGMGMFHGKLIVK